MAGAVLTETRVSSWIDRQGGNYREGYVDISWPDSADHLAAGDSFDTDNFAPGITLSEMTPVNGGTATYEFVVDLDNAKILTYARIGGVVVADTTNLNGLTQRFYYRGI